MLIGCSFQTAGDPVSVNNQNNSEEREDRTIVPGFGTSTIHLGLTRNDLLVKLGEPVDEYTHSGHCEYNEIHWLPNVEAAGDVEGEGVFAFLKNDKVVELRFGEGYHLNDKIRYGSRLQDLNTASLGSVYRLHPSANASTNYVDLMFSVRQSDGVAFEIGVDLQGRRSVNAIYVFEPEKNFEPWGCLSENQTLEPTNL